MYKDKICIIGAGPSGISALLSFYKEQQNITCYEKQGGLGWIMELYMANRY